LNESILSFKTKGVRSIIICPSLIYGISQGPAKHSIQVPWLIALAKKGGVAKHYGPGENIWCENSMRQICEAINRKLGVKVGTVPMSLDEASREWGEGAAQNTMGSNSRVRAVGARADLGWHPSRPPLIDEIESGCYAACLTVR
jgi:hypothetical protein